MKMNQKRIDSIYRQTETALPTFTIDKNKSDLLFPLDVKTGFVNATEEGLTFNPNVEDFARWERIFTGFEAISVIWEGSTQTYVETINKIQKIRKNFQPGKSKVIQFSSDNLSDSFTSFTDSGVDFIKQSVEVDATFYIKGEVPQNEMKKLYIVPKRYGKTVLYIDNVVRYNDPKTNTIKYCEITLKSLNDKIAASGGAIDQFIQFSAPGEGYAYPKITEVIKEEDRLERFNEGLIVNNIKDMLDTHKIKDKIYLVENFIDDKNILLGECLVKFNGRIHGVEDWEILKTARGYILDNSKLLNRPVRTVQFELYSPSLLSSIGLYGRPLKKIQGQNDEILHSRPLLPSKKIVSDNSQRRITRPAVQTNEFIWINNSRLELETYYKDWKESMIAEANPGIVKKWLGYLRVLVSHFDEKPPVKPWWMNMFDGIKAGLTGNFELIGDGPVKHHEKEGNIIKIDPDRPYGYFQRLTLNYFTLPGLTRLPIDYTESVSWDLKSIPLIGGVLDQLNLGLPLAFKSQAETGGKNLTLTGIMSGPLYEFYKNVWDVKKVDPALLEKMDAKDIKDDEKNAEYYTALPLDGFSDEAQQAVISPGEFATVIKFSLTDDYWTDTSLKLDKGLFTTNMTKDDVLQGLKPSNTKDLKYINEDGTTKAEWNDTSLAKEKDWDNEFYDGFAIDTFGFQALGKGDYKITFFDENDEAIYSGSYKTLSKLTGSVRDWQNTLKLSNWDVVGYNDGRIIAPASKLELPQNVESLNNGIKNGILKPSYVKDDDNVVQRDSNGNPLIELDEKGMEIYYLKENILPDYIQPGAAGIVKVPLTGSSSIDLDWDNYNGFTHDEGVITNFRLKSVISRGVGGGILLNPIHLGYIDNKRKEFRNPFLYYDWDLKEMDIDPLKKSIVNTISVKQLIGETQYNNLLKQIKDNNYKRFSIDSHFNTDVYYKQTSGSYKTARENGNSTFYTRDVVQQFLGVDDIPTHLTNINFTIIGEYDEVNEKLKLIEFVEKDQFYKQGTFINEIGDYSISASNNILTQTINDNTENNKDPQIVELTLNNNDEIEVKIKSLLKLQSPSFKNLWFERIVDSGIELGESFNAKFLYLNNNIVVDNILLA